MEKRMNWQGFAVLAALILTAFIAGTILIRGQLEKEKEKSTALQLALNQAYEVNTQLVSRLKLVDTAGYIENSARKDLNYIKPGELRFQFENPEALYAYSPQELEILMEELAE